MRFFGKRSSLLLFALLLTASAQAHQTSDSYLSLEFAATNITGQWDLAVKDLDFVIPLDDNKDGDITAEELKTHEKAISDYALAHLAAKIDGQPRPVHITDQTVAFHLTGPYVELHLVMDGSSEGRELELTSTPFFEQHPQHNGLLLIDYLGQKQASVFTENKTRQTFLLLAPEGPNLSQQFLSFGKEGVWHIWRGYDHILFLLALLFPAVLTRKADAWQPVEAFRPALINVLKIVTAFTLAHSITLSLATLEIIKLPTRLTESAIAASVVLAALNNIFPVITKREWVVAFVFGLIHGFGFASALTEMGFSHGNLALTIIGFNLGVEGGQLAIVAVFLPLAYLTRKSWAYQRVTLAFGSSIIVIIAAGWLVDRVFNLNFMPF